jgi:hypothetical protein
MIAVEHNVQLAVVVSRNKLTSLQEQYDVGLGVLIAVVCELGLKAFFNGTCTKTKYPASLHRSHSMTEVHIVQPGKYTSHFSHMPDPAST